MNTTLAAGRILFCIPFLVNGTMHFMKTEDLAGVVPAYFPAPIIWVYLTGLGMLLAVISILTTKFLRLTGVLLGVMLILFATTIHLPMAMSDDPNTMMLGMSNTLKDLGLAGGGFILSGTYWSK